MTNETKRQIRSGGALGRKGAAAYLSISTRLLDDLLTAGEIPKIKIGRKTICRVADLDAYLERLASDGVASE